MAALAVTKGIPVSIHLFQARFNAAHSTPTACQSTPRCRPETRSLSRVRRASDRHVALVPTRGKPARTSHAGTAECARASNRVPTSRTCLSLPRSLGVPQGLHSRMEVSRAPVPASRESLLARNNKRADDGIRMCATGALSSLANGLANGLVRRLPSRATLGIWSNFHQGKRSRWPKSPELPVGVGRISPLSMRSVATFDPPPTAAVYR